MVEHALGKGEVVGSIPTQGSKYGDFHLGPILLSGVRVSSADLILLYSFLLSSLSFTIRIWILRLGCVRLVTVKEM